MDDAQKNRLRIYAWSYFAYHADQRLKAFNFFLLLVLGLTAAVIALLGKTPDMNSRPVAILCFVVTFAAIVFALLDRRNARLVKNGEAALEWLDALEGHAREESIPHVLEIFALDHHRSAHSGNLLSSDWSYSDIFTIVFLFFGAGSFLIGILFL